LVLHQREGLGHLIVRRGSEGVPARGKKRGSSVARSGRESMQSGTVISRTEKKNKNFELHRLNKHGGKRSKVSYYFWEKGKKGKIRRIQQMLLGEGGPRNHFAPRRETQIGGETPRNLKKEKGLEKKKGRGKKA